MIKKCFRLDSIFFLISARRFGFIEEILKIADYVGVILSFEVIGNVVAEIRKWLWLTGGNSGQCQSPSKKRLLKSPGNT